MAPDADLGSSANLFSVDGIGVKHGTFYAPDRDVARRRSWQRRAHSVRPVTTPSA
ncbi:MAG TPA: hypothetical protein VJV78_36625 [Polyangiales bacterium]|nr:hypothetical protein [Polyangiales bacterium]